MEASGGGAPSPRTAARAPSMSEGGKKCTGAAAGLTDPFLPGVSQMRAAPSTQGDAAANHVESEVVCGKALARWRPRWHSSC